MSQVLGPTLNVDGPIPVRPRFGLLDAAQIVTPDLDPHWMVGVQAEGYSDDMPGVHVPCNDGSIADVKDDGGPITNPVFGPFTVYLPVTCSSFHSRPHDRFIERARTAFEAKEGWGVEREFAQGNDQPLNAFLSDADVTLITDGPYAPGEALARLENAVAGHAVQGMIHADPATVTAWQERSLLFRDGQVLRTIVGTPVVAGAGYVGTRPGGQAVLQPDQAWVFASGQVQIRRSAAEAWPGDIPGALTPETNEVTERIERHYIVVWDTSIQYGVLVDRGS
jgi:hypothetical protein